jgi:diaminopimelate epimerase
MNIQFAKMQAQGNDFIIVNRGKVVLENALLPKLAQDVCNRHFGIGADGLVLLDTDKREKVHMAIYNADGSKAEMCGSALRCCCVLLTKDSNSKEIEIFTDSGLSKGIIDNENQNYVTVEIGSPKMVKYSFILDGFKGDYVTIGNPHFVIYTHDLTSNPHLSAGKALSENSQFTNGANIEFVKVITKDEIDMVIWERGAGVTLACGTGATAAVFSGQYNHLLNDKVKVNVPGGSITITKKSETYYLGGEVSFVGTGDYIWTI